ncbi:methylenetetrahydrofolate reductase [NAD(P)H] [bacterium]|nr:methylenetetrahydrofolate reductase [NAD(P)H] [bacterium]
MKNLYQRGDVVFSFEVFPPKTPQGFESLYRTVGELAGYKPGFISVTYGAGGSTQSQTLEIIQQIRQRFSLATTAHFTLVGATVDQLVEFLEQAEGVGAENIMALRGDPPQGQTKFQPVPGGLSYANELVALIRERFPAFGIGVGGYPETHQEATSPDDDLAHLKRKVDAGADAIFTQLFYDNADFLRFRDRATEVGIRPPMVPGLLPILSLAQVKRITALCGSKLPTELLRQLESCGDDAAAQAQVGIEHCTRQCEDLLHEGVPGIHFYVLNRSDSVRQIMANLFPASVVGQAT